MNLLVQKQVVDSMLVGRFAHEDWADWRGAQVLAHAGTLRALSTGSESTGWERTEEGVRRSGARKVRTMGRGVLLRDGGFRRRGVDEERRFGA